MAYFRKFCFAFTALSVLMALAAGNGFVQLAQAAPPKQATAGVSDLGMLPHDSPLFRCQRCRLEQDCVGNADLADIVQQCAPIYLTQLLRIRGEAFCEHQRMARDPFRVQAAFVFARIEGGRQRFHQHCRRIVMQSMIARAQETGLERLRAFSRSERRCTATAI